MLNKDYYIILSIIDTLNKITRYTKKYSTAEEFYNIEKDFDATMMNIIVLGEEVGKLSDDFKNSNTQINWTKIYGLRNIVAHHYFGINVDTVWQIIKNDIPKLKIELNKIS